MGASLMQPCRVYEEGLRVVKYFQRGEGVVVNNRSKRYPQKKHHLTPCAAAAVIRRVQALIGITGRKAHAGDWGIRNWQA